MLGSSAMKMRRVNRNRPTVPLDVSLSVVAGQKPSSAANSRRLSGSIVIAPRGRPPAYRMSVVRPENIPVGGCRLPLPESVRPWRTLRTADSVRRSAKFAVRQLYQYYRFRKDWGTEFYALWVRSTAPKSGTRSGIDRADWLSCPNRLSIAAYFRPALRPVPQRRPAVYAINHERAMWWSPSRSGFPARSAFER
jgi:hypothetical protein